jgi:hypothetical protein
MTTIDPTLEQFEAMLAAECAGFAAWHAAEAVHGELSQQYREASARRFAATKAIREARPTDPAVLAKQTRWLLHVFEDCAANDADLGTLAHVVNQLESLAARQAPAGMARPLSSTF